MILRYFSINMKKVLISVVVTAIVIISLGSCGSTKNVTYFQNIDSVSLAASRGLFDAKIMPKDRLTITVSTTNPEAGKPFNLSVSSVISSTGSLSSGVGSLLPYLVDNDGFINFPIIGKIHVAGLTKTECEDLIKSKIQPYMARTENPVVVVQMSSYRVTVTGEVNNPGVYPVETEKMSIIEALAKAGDLTIYGLRDNIALIRTDANGETSAVRAHRIRPATTRR